MREPMVTVLTIVHNGAAFLRECIDSVLAQTYTNWRHTIVNNCSTDASLEIALQYAARDSRITVESNAILAGLVESHNIAFRKVPAESGYCKMVYADDWLYPTCLEQMVRLAEANPRVAIVGAYALAGNKVVWDGLPYNESVVAGREICRRYLLRQPFVFGNPNSVLYRSDIVRSREHFFRPVFHADTEACLEFLVDNDFGFVHQVLSYTRIREGSARSYSQTMNTYLPYELFALQTYGPRYLTGADQSAQIEACLDRYYAYLARQIWRRRSADFWSLHRQALQDAGHPLSPTRLAVTVSNQALDQLLNPKRSLERAFRRRNGD